MPSLFTPAACGEHSIDINIAIPADTRVLLMSNMDAPYIDPALLIARALENDLVAHFVGMVEHAPMAWRYDFESELRRGLGGMEVVDVEARLTDTGGMVRYAAINAEAVVERLRPLMSSWAIAAEMGPTEKGEALSQNRLEQRILQLETEMGLGEDRAALLTDLGVVSNRADEDAIELLQLFADRNELLTQEKKSFETALAERAKKEAWDSESTSIAEVCESALGQIHATLERGRVVSGDKVARSDDAEDAIEGEAFTMRQELEQACVREADDLLADVILRTVKALGDAMDDVPEDFRRQFLDRYVPRVFDDVDFSWGLVDAEDGKGFEIECAVNLTRELQEKLQEMLTLWAVANDTAKIDSARYLVDQSELIAAAAKQLETRLEEQDEVGIVASNREEVEEMIRVNQFRSQEKLQQIHDPDFERIVSRRLSLIHI